MRYVFKRHIFFVLFKIENIKMNNRNKNFQIQIHNHKTLYLSYTILSYPTQSLNRLALPYRIHIHRIASLAN